MNSRDATHITPTDAPARPNSRRGIANIGIGLSAIGLLTAFAIVYAFFIWLPAARHRILEYDLKEFAMRYHNFHDAHRRSPASVDELAAFNRTTPDILPRLSEHLDAPTAFQAIRECRLILIWYADLQIDAEYNARHVLAYERQVSKEGGIVGRACR